MAAAAPGCACGRPAPRRRSPGRRSATRTPSWATRTGTTTPSQSDVMLDQSGYVELLGRVGGQELMNPGALNAYHLRVSDSGAWSILRTNTVRADHHAAQRHHRRAGHRPLAHRRARLLRQHHHRHRRRHRGRHRHRLHLRRRVWRASAPARARPRSSTTSASPPARRWRRHVTWRCATSTPTGAWTSRTSPRPTARSWHCGTATAAPTSSGRSPPPSSSRCTATSAWTSGTAPGRGHQGDHLGLHRRHRPAVEHQRRQHRHQRAVRPVPRRERRRNGQRHRGASSGPATAGTTRSGREADPPPPGAPISGAICLGGQHVRKGGEKCYEHAIEMLIHRSS